MDRGGEAASGHPQPHRALLNPAPSRDGNSELPNDDALLRSGAKPASSLKNGGRKEEDRRRGKREPAAKDPLKGFVAEDDGSARENVRLLESEVRGDRSLPDGMTDRERRLAALKLPLKGVTADRPLSENVRHAGRNSKNQETRPTSKHGEQEKRRAALKSPLNGVIAVEGDDECLLPEGNGCVVENKPYVKQNGAALHSIREVEFDDSCVKSKPRAVNARQDSVDSILKPKSIVKTPSDLNHGHRRVSIKSDQARSPKGRGIVKSDSADGDRPVLHVQFHNGCVDGSVTTGPARDARSSPASSVEDSSGDGASGSSSSSEDNSSLGLAEARPPDGGWGWVVVFATFMVNLIADGISFSFGVMYVNFLEYFGEGKAKTAWIGSVFMAMPLLSGPIASFLTDRYGCRRMCIVGSILACIGFVLSAFTTNMETLFITFGIVSGFGLSLCYVAAVVIVAYYFEKKRSLATGLSVCGSGIGTFIFAPLTQMLLEKYGWRGTTLILAGFFLNISVCGALMRDLAWTAIMAKAKAQDRKRSREQKRLKRYGSSADSFSDSKSTNTVGTASAPPAGEIVPIGESSETNTRQFSSLVNLPTYVNNGENVPVEVLELLATHKNVYNVLMQNYPSMLVSSRSFSDSGRLNEAGSKPGSMKDTARPINRSPLRLNQTPAVPTVRPTTAYLKDLRIHRHSLTYRGAMLNINRYRLRASSCPNIYRNSMTTIAKEKQDMCAGMWEFWDVIVDMFDFSHFANPHFLLFAISNFLLYAWYDVPYVYITDYAVEMGYTETDASMLISVIGIVNMVGEIFLGWAGDWEWVNASVVYACCMLLCGVVTAIVPLLTSYMALCAASGAFGLFIAANYSLTSIILVELITLENFTNAYGLLLLVQGVANLIGPPLAGWIYDVTGTYELSFYIAGSFISLSGLFLLILPATRRLKMYRSLRRRETASASISSIEDNNCVVTANNVHEKDKNCRIFV